MIVDTSAIMAILLDEEDWPRFGAVIANEPDLKLSAGTWIELGAVMTRARHPDVEARFAHLIENVRFKIIPVSLRHAELGHAAYREFGRGSDHPARLNFGDCFAYALAKETGEPLLFKGNDFSRTDIRSAL